jgi:transcriptional regulator with XRE-family HTH domain
MDELFFSKNLNQYLKREGISIKELSLRLSVPLSTVHGWLNGVEPKSINELKKVAIFMGLSLDELCYGHYVQMVSTNIQVSIGQDSYTIVLSKLINQNNESS